MLESCSPARAGHRDHPAAGASPRRRRRDPLQRHRRAAQGGRASTSTSCRASGPVVAEPIRTRPTSTRLRRRWRRRRRVVTEAVAAARRPSSATSRSSASPARPSPWPRYLVEGGPSREHARTQGADVRRPDALGRAAATGSRRSRGDVPAGAGRGRARARSSSSTPGSGALSAARLPRPCCPHSAAVLGRGRRPRRAADPLRRRHRRAAARHGRGRAPTSSASTSGCRWTSGPPASVPGTAVQGNLDPAVLFAPVAGGRARVGTRALAAAGPAPGHVFNLGHGVPPDTDPDVLTRVVDLVHQGPAAGPP